MYKHIFCYRCAFLYFDQSTLLHEMDYSLRNKKKLHHGGPAGDAGNEPTKENRIADKPSVQPPNHSNSSKEDKTILTNPSELKTTIAKTSIATELGNINHNLDVFTQNIQESPEKFKESNILVLEICSTMDSPSNKRYRFLCKVGSGGFSVVWLVIDMNTKEFKVAKVFIFGYGITKNETEILHKTSNHPNILRFYEHLFIYLGGRPACVAFYEPLGKDLYTLMKEASKYGGLSVPVIKKVAKHVLMALKAIHDLKVIHTDIKLNNIATCVFQLSLRRELEKIVEFMKSGQNISSLRMVCQKDIEIDVNEKRKYFEEELEKVSKLEMNDVTELIFKLIDFGNAMKEGTERRTGTYGFRPPEYFFGSPLLHSHDIWSLGVTIVVLLTNKRFLEGGNGSQIDEVTVLRNMFGKFSRRHFKNFKDLDGYKTKFSTRHYSPVKAKNRIAKFLRIKLVKLQMDDKDRNELIGFLLQMLNTVPNERKSAAELLLHPWLNDISECEFNGQHDLTQKFSDSFKTQERKETSINEIETSHAYVAVPLPSKSKDTSETSLDDQSNDEEIKIKDVVITLPSNEPKHSKNVGETTEKTKKETKKILRHDSFIYKENDGKYYLFHKYWRIPYLVTTGFFRCPKCFISISLECKVGFLMVSDKNWHKSNMCPIGRNAAPQKGHCFKVAYKDENQRKKHFRNIVITKEEVDRKRKSLEDEGYKLKIDEVLPDAIPQKETEMLEDNDYEYDDSEYGTDSDLDETEEDSNETISEFSSGESYFEDDASYSPCMENFLAEEIGELIDPELCNI